jgi:hypothetical protein
VWSFSEIKSRRENMRNKRASSQASWSILAGSVADARVEAYKLRIAVNQMVDALRESPAIEEVHRLCGDSFLTIPDTLANIERNLDKTNYALITMGADFYRQRLPHSDRETVDIAAKFNPAPEAARNINSEVRVAGASGAVYMEISDAISEALEGGQRIVKITRSQVTPLVYDVLLSHVEDGLVVDFGRYLQITQKGIEAFLLS